MAKNNNNKNNNNKNNNNKNNSSKQEVKAQAKEAAASGNFNKSNAQALKDAGVKTSNIQTIRSVSKDTKATNANATAARNNPTYQGAGFQNAIQNQAAGGKVGQDFYNSLDAGVRGDLSPQQVAEYAMSQGYGLGDQWQKDFGTQKNPAQTLKEAMKGDSKMRLGALLKMAAGQGKGTDLVNNKEFKRIHGYFDGNKNGLKITNKMDKINAKQAGKENGYNPMGLQVGTFDKINKNKYGDARDIAWNAIGGSSSMIGGKEGMSNIARKQGKNGGALSQLALNYKGSNIEGMKGNHGVYGADAHGNAIFSPGQGGKSWSQNKINKSTKSTYSPWATGVESVTPPGGTTGPSGTDGPTTPPGFGSGGVGDGGEKNALTFRSAKSRWKNNGRATKGTSGLKYSRAAGFGGFGASAATF